MMPKFFTTAYTLNIILTTKVTEMRVMVRAIFPTEVGNRVVKDPNFIKNIQGFIENN